MVNNDNNKDIYKITSSVPAASGYEISFKFYKSSDVKVFVTTDTGDQEIETSNFAISYDSSVAKVIFKSTYSFPTNTAYLTILRSLQPLQNIDLKNGDVIDAETIEEMVDRLTILLQQLRESISRSILLSVSETEPLSIPSPETRKNSLLGFDDKGKTITILTSDIEQKLSEALEAEEHTIQLKEETNQIKTDTQEISNTTFIYKDEAEKAATYAQSARSYILRVMPTIENMVATMKAINANTERLANSAEQSNQESASNLASVRELLQNVTDLKEDCEDILTSVTTLKNESLAYKNQSATHATAAETARAQALGYKDNTNTIYQNALSVLNQMQALKTQFENITSTIVTPIVVINGQSYTVGTVVRRGRVFNKYTPITNT